MTINWAEVTDHLTEGCAVSYVALLYTDGLSTRQIAKKLKV